MARDTGFGGIFFEAHDTSGDPGSPRILKENLKKKRLISTDPLRAAGLAKRITAARKSG